MPLPLVHVGVPVWRGEDFVGETLHSILSQSGIRVSVFISVDGADSRSASVCEEFLADPRTSLAVQDRHLGWVENCNAVLEAGWLSSADFFCIQPHDDLMEPGYLAELVRAAEASPGAAALFSDIATFGDLSMEIRQRSVTGEALERQLILLREHFSAVAFRALIRRSCFEDVPLLRPNDWENFAADTVFMARLALGGDLLRVARPLYRKRFHAGNTHTKWRTWEADRQIAAWARHCVDICAEALPAARDESERAAIVGAARERLLHSVGAFFPELANDITSSQQALLNGLFEDGTREIGFPERTVTPT